MLASDIVAIVIASLGAAFVVIVVIGLHVWGAIQDGREERELRSRRPRPPWP